MKRARALPALLLVLAFALTTACGSVTKTAYNGLTGLKGVYVGANEIRNGYCAPAPQPKPAVCIDSYKPFVVAFHVLAEGTRLLSVAVSTKDQTTLAQLQAFADTIPIVLADLVKAVAEINAAKAPPTVAGAPAPVK